MNNSVDNKSFLSVLFSPAVGLAVLGTGAFIFSFYRAGQLSNLVLPKDFPKDIAKPTLSQPKEPTLVVPAIDINSRDLLTAIDTSDAAKIAQSGDRQHAVTEALQTLTDNPPNDVTNIAIAGDIFSTSGGNEDKTLGLALLAKALTMAPNNQYLACRYAQRMASNGQLDEAAQRLADLLKKQPQLASVHLLLAKVLWLQGKSEQAENELLKIKDGEKLSAKERSEAALILVKTGRVFDGYKLFRQAMSGKPEARFYADYCGGSLPPSVDDYKTALAVVEANLNNTADSDQLPLEIKEAALLLLLDRSTDAKAALEQSLKRHKYDVELQILLSAANFSAGDPDQALAYLESAAENYQPTL